MKDAHASDAFRIGTGRVELRDGDTIVSAMADFGGGNHELKVVVRGHDLAVAPPAMGDALLSMSLTAAMTRAQTLEVADPVSPQLLETVNQVQRILHIWFPYLSMVDVKAPVFAGETAAPSGGTGKRAHFFSGGVDSLHSATTDSPSLDALVFVEGSDMANCYPELRSETAARLTQVAARLNLPLVFVESNVREWAMACGRHSDDFISARLAMIAHLMGERFDEWVIAPSILGRIDPLSSHPMIDPLWSSGRVRIIHAVPDRTRAEKTWDLGQEDGCLENLRVCMMGDVFNCGECRKCMRTLLTLKVLGIADHAPVFTRSPEIPELLEQLSATRQLKNECQFLRETIDTAREINVEARLVDQLEKTLTTMKARMAWQQIEAAGKEAFFESRWDTVPLEARRACFRKLLAGNPEWLAKELAADLPGQKEAVFASLWKSERRWLKRRLRNESLRRLARKLGFRH